MITPALKSKIETLVGVGALTFAAAFVGVLASVKIPITLDEWKPILATALAAAVTSELVYLRTALASALAANAGTVLATIESTASSVTSVAKDIAVKSLGVLAVLALFGCGASMPQTACASNPALTTQAEVDACRAAARDASADVMHAVVVDATPVAKDGGK